MAISATAAKIGQVLEGVGSKTIGALVFWSLSGVDIGRAELRQEFQDAGLGAAVPRDPRESTLLTSAMRRTMVGRSDTFTRRFSKGWGIVLEIPGPPNERGEHKLIHQHVASVHVETMQIAVDRARMANPQRLAPELVWRFHGQAEHVVRAQAVALVVEQEYRNAADRLDTSDLSNVLVNLMHGTTRDPLLAAVSLRQSTGGLYFVHASKVDQARQVRDLVQRLSPQSSFVVMTLTGEADNLDAAAQSAELGFTSQLAELRDEVREFLAKTPRSELTDRSVRIRADRFQLLRARVELFRDVLGTVAGELQGQIELAREQLQKEAGL